jgi:hypothetical protein
MESTDYPSSRSFRDYLIESFQDPEDAAGVSHGDFGRTRS